ncbi:MAG: TolC family protein [Bacteroidales bacterium]|nr:TolC family protein [Bacteroidales bacterium]
MKYIVPVLLLTFSAAHAQLGDTLTLFECHEKVIQADPQHRQLALLETQNDLKTKNIGLNWLPSLDVNGSYTYQSEVVELGEVIPIPGFDAPLMPHYNYKLTLDIKQNVYDGGLTKSRKELERTTFEASRQQVEVELNQLKERVNQIFFYLLILQQQEWTVQIMLNELMEKRRVVESGVENGILMESDLNVMDAEILNVDQQLSEILISWQTAVDMLEKLINEEIKVETIFEVPEVVLQLDANSQRPEYQLFDLQMMNLDASKNLANTSRKPKMYVFGTVGMGNPALNFFKDELRGYYIVGAGLHWNIWDWSKTSREREVLTIQQDILQTRKESFDKNLKIQLDEQVSSIRKLEESIKKDEQIVILREKISASSTSQLENGVITSSDYITDLNAETISRIRLETHKIQLIQSKINYMTIKGEL